MIGVKSHDIKDQTVRTSDLSMLRELPLFASMSPAAFAALVRAAYLQTFPARLELITEGDPADFLYVVVDGCVELFARSNGRETTMGMVRPVGAFILAAVLKDAVNLMSARTLHKARLLLIPALHVRAAFAEDDAFARSIVAELAGAYRSLVREQKNLKLRTALERLANRLIRYDGEQGGSGTVRLPHDKRTIASLIGITPENLSRAFHTLRAYGVEVDGAVVRLTDRPALVRLAKPNPLIDGEEG